MTTNISKQHYIGKWWGLFKLLLQHIGSYIQIINLVMISGTFYVVVTDKFGNVPVVAFIVIMILIIAGLMAFEYKYSWISFFSVWNWQVWEAKNPLKDEINSVKAKQEEHDTQFAEIKKMIKELKSASDKRPD